MTQTASFRVRLLLAITLVILLSLSASSWYFSHALGQHMLREAQHDAVNQLELVAAMLEGDTGLTSGRQVRGWLSEIPPRLGMSFGFISTKDAQQMLDWPEVSTALEGGLGMRVDEDGLTGHKRIMVARFVKLSQAGSAGVLRLSFPISRMDNMRQSLLGSMLLGAAGVLCLGALLSFILARQLTSQIEYMSQMAEAIGLGDYSKRLRLYPGKEFASLASSINQMADSIQAQIQTITVQKEQLIAILDNMKEGVMLLGADGRIRAVNRALTRIFPGIDSAQGRTPLEAVMDPRFQQACDQVLQGLGEPVQGPTILQLEPRRGQVYEVGIVPLRERQAGLGAVAVFHDISRLKHLERIRRDFVANVSHELRTPLTSIKGYAETLQDDPRLPQDATRFLDVIAKNANHMAKIVGDLLNLSRLEAGQDILEARPVEASAALTSALRECEPLARARGIVLKQDLPGLEFKVLADYDRLVQVFRNLLENAFRYSPEGGEVSITATPREGEVVFGVSDHGPGIPAGERSKIFERFYRVEKHRTKSGLPGSSGLGLAISKHIVERHGGRIWVVSPAQNSDTGTTFLFTIPAAEGTMHRARINSNTPEQPQTPA